MTHNKTVEITRNSLVISEMATGILFFHLPFVSGKSFHLFALTMGLDLYTSACVSMGKQSILSHSHKSPL